MQGFGLVVRFVLRPGQESAFDALVVKTLDGIRQHEPGTLVYATHTVEDDPRLRLFYELYQDRHAFEVHESQPHTQRFLAAREAYVESYSVDFLTALNSKGIGPGA